MRVALRDSPYFFRALAATLTLHAGGQVFEPVTQAQPW